MLRFRAIGYGTICVEIKTEGLCAWKPEIGSLKHFQIKIPVVININCKNLSAIVGLVTVTVVRVSIPDLLHGSVDFIRFCFFKNFSETIVFIIDFIHFVNNGF